MQRLTAQNTKRGGHKKQAFTEEQQFETQEKQISTKTTKLIMLKAHLAEAESDQT